MSERLGTSEQMMHEHYGHTLEETTALAVQNLPAIGYAHDPATAAY